MPDSKELEPLLVTVDTMAQWTRRHPEAIRRYIRKGIVSAIPDPNYKAGPNQRLLIPWHEYETIAAQPMLDPKTRKPIKLERRETVLTYSDGSTITVPITMDPRPVPLR
jgi:hypothetical protein